MTIKITSYNAVCNLGNDIGIIYDKALKGSIYSFNYFDNFIKGSWLYLGAVTGKLPEIKNKDYNLRCNRLILRAIKNIQDKIDRTIDRYGAENTAVIAAGTNSGIEEFEASSSPKHFEQGNSAEFLRGYLGLEGFYTGVSTACSSGIKALSLGCDLLNSSIAGAVIIACADALSKTPLYGFNSLGVLADRPSVPFSANRSGMNIGEGAAVFILEKDVSDGIEIMGIGESTDISHMTNPDENAVEAVNAFQRALEQAGIKPGDIDYINAHGTGTIANDIMEARAVNEVFGKNTPVSSTKPMTGHCLGAAAGIETALCCRLLDDFRGRFFPHIYDGVYDSSLPEIRLVNKDEKYEKCSICLCSSFGFGGADAAVILGKRDEK